MTQKKKMFPSLLPELEPETFQSWVHCSTTELPQLPKAWLCGANAVSVLPCIGGRTCSGVCGPVWHGPRKLNATYNNDISADHESHMLGDVGHKVNKCRAVFWVSSQHQHLGPAKCHSMSQHFGGATGAMGCVLTLQALWRWGCFILWHFVITLDVHQSGVSGILMYNLQWQQERQRYIDKTAT